MSTGAGLFSQPCDGVNLGRLGFGLVMLAGLRFRQHFPISTGVDSMILRIPVLPAIVREGVITFNTVTLTLPDFPSKSEHDHERFLQVNPSDPVNIYLDPSKQPKFSRCPPGIKGWQSPTAEYVEQCDSAGIDCDYLTIINCKCQRGELTREDVLSLEACGHAVNCEQAPKTLVDDPVFRKYEESIRERINKLENPRSSNVDREILDQIERGEDPNPKKSEDFRPPGGIPVNTVLPNLVAYMDGMAGNEVNVTAALEAIGWKEPVDEFIVIKQLAKFQNFTICNGCSNWTSVMNMSNPRCPGCSPVNSPSN